MNYGEEHAYWYLRLNGFFPINDFVVHRTEANPDRSDIDVLAVRLPYVYEEVGGTERDWDPYLRDRLPFQQTLGVVCEVKTGRFDARALFRPECLRIAVARLGIAPPAQLDQVLAHLDARGSAEVPGGGHICKLLISEEEAQQGPYIHRTLQQVEGFIDQRIEQYVDEKHGARMFFPSWLFQARIAFVHRRT